MFDNNNRPVNPDLSSKLVGPLLVVIKVRILETSTQKGMPPGGQSIFQGKAHFAPQRAIQGL